MFLGLPVCIWTGRAASHQRSIVMFDCNIAPTSHIDIKASSANVMILKQRVQQLWPMWILPVETSQHQMTLMKLVTHGKYLCSCYYFWSLHMQIKSVVCTDARMIQQNTERLHVKSFDCKLWPSAGTLVNVLLDCSSVSVLTFTCCLDMAAKNLPLSGSIGFSGYRIRVDRNTLSWCLHLIVALLGLRLREAS